MGTGRWIRSCRKGLGGVVDVIAGGFGEPDLDNTSNDICMVDEAN